MSSTSRMVENSGVILDNIYQELLDNPHIKVLILAGDLQHKIPNNRQLVTSWIVKLKTIREELVKRFPEDVKVYKDGDLVEPNKVNPLISLKGNHDIHKEGKFTFFDELETLGYIGRYDSIVWGGTQYNLYDYGQADKGLEGVYERKEDKVVGLFHDAFAYPGSPKWMMDNVGNGIYDLSQLQGLDVAIIGHIHDRISPIKVSHEDKSETIFWQPGCIARTSYSTPNKRDTGYSAYIDNTSLNMYALDIDVVSSKGYFKELKNDLKKAHENSLKEFSLNLSETTINFNSYEEEIQAMEVEESVKDKAILLIDEVQD